jgi:multisubunit Na+/H+ antiporter MnhC subunit
VHLLMTATDQVLAAIVVGLAICIISLCWSLQQAHHRLDELEVEVYDDEDQDQDARTHR